MSKKINGKLIYSTDFSQLIMPSSGRLLKKRRKKNSNIDDSALADDVPFNPCHRWEWPQKRTVPWHKSITAHHTRELNIFACHSIIPKPSSKKGILNSNALIDMWIYTVKNNLFVKIVFAFIFLTHTANTHAQAHYIFAYAATKWHSFSSSGRANNVLTLKTVQTFHQTPINNYSSKWYATII